MATQHISPAPHAPASSPPYPMATPGYGKRSVPGQLPCRTDDFALLPTRERYVAGFVDHLPEGAAMSVKTLAKQLPLYGQQAISTALTALSVAGHLRRVRCAVGQGDTTRWAFRTFWSRTAHDNEWWNAYLAAESTRDAAPAPAVTASSPAPDVTASSTAPPPPWAPAENPPPLSPPEAPRGEPARQAVQFPRTDTAPEPAEDAEPAKPPAPVSVPHQRTPSNSNSSDTAPAPGPARGTAPAATPTPGPTSSHSPAYLALARLGRTDHRLGLSAGDCAALEAQAAEWLARGVDANYLTAALTAGLPAHVDSPVGFVRRRLLVECTECGAPGRPEALPDGLCRPCRTARSSSTADEPVGAVGLPDAPGIGAYIAELRDLLKAP
ncbi:MarR family transcriptional regulator [Streptomyces sp. ARC12]|uniref:MarR family transcriptional regulator n=1 Tax=Streptomyces sp. ARC12 TaxID=2724151 RepID=UPI0038576A8C